MSPESARPFTLRYVFGEQNRVHRSGFLGLSHDLPVMISVIDTEEKIRHALPVFDEMVDEGLIALSDVEIIKHTHSKSEEKSGEMGELG